MGGWKHFFNKRGGVIMNRNVGVEGKINMSVNLPSHFIMEQPQGWLISSMCGWGGGRKWGGGTSHFITAE